MKRPIVYLLIKNRRERRRRGIASRQTFIGRAGFSAATLLLLLLASFLALAAWQYADLIRGLPQVEELASAFDPDSGMYAHPTQLFDRGQNELLVEIGMPGVTREYASISRLDGGKYSDLVNAMVAATQPDFWDSPGYSLRTLNSEEHPTITQKLVFSLLLSDEPAGVRRALRERLLAGRVVSVYGHQQALEWYLNSVSFGNYAYGVEAAAWTYFDKASAQLDLSEAAMLAGVSLAPAVNPWDSPAGARSAQQKVLEQMVSQGMISADVYRQALLAEVNITPRQDDPLKDWSVFIQQAVTQLEASLGKEKVERGGLVVQTTLDIDLQFQADCVQAAVLESLEQPLAGSGNHGNCPAANLLPLLPPTDPLPHGSLTSSVGILDPRTGQVLALSEMGAAPENDWADGLDVGSLVTPFIYLSGFAQGGSPAALVWDVPDTDLDMGQWHVKKYQGPVSVRTAMVNDYLTPAAKMMALTGSAAFEKLMQSLGLDGNLHGEPTLLPVLSANLVDVARAYGMLANGGLLAGTQVAETSIGSEANYILSVVDGNGRTIVDNEIPVELAVVSQQLAYLVNHVLSDDSARAGDPVLIGILNAGMDAAIKTGQVADGRSVFTVGYTPNRVIVTRMADAGVSSQITMEPRWAAGAWRALMQYSLTDSQGFNWTEPAGITHLNVCYPSGLLPDEDCPKIVPEIFISGNEPHWMDDLYQSAEINYETGNLATVFTPPQMVQKKVFLQVPERYQAWAEENQLPSMPVTYDPVQPARLDPEVHITFPEMFAVVSGKVAITGTAGGENFASYRLDVGQGLNPHAWYQVGAGHTTPVSAGLLAEWDTAGLQGLYALRLQVITRDGLVQTHIIQLTVGE